MVGKLSVTPVTARNIPDIQGAKFFVGCFIQETEKHRTHSVEGREPTWKDTLTCQVPEGQRHVLTVELVNESPNGGLLGYGKVDLQQVLSQGNESRWVPLTSTHGQPLGELKLDLSLNGSSAVNSVTSSMGSMHLTEQANYFPDNHRQGSFSSLGPANPIPQNYGSGNPPPFTPPAPIRYNSESSMPSPGGPTTVNTENLTREEFEEGQAKGTIPTWAKYGGGVLAGAAALGMAAWGAHELKEHLEKKEQEKYQQKPVSDQNLPYKIENQQKPPSYSQQQQPPSYAQQPSSHAQPPSYAQHQSQPPSSAQQPHREQQHHFDKKEHKEKKKDKKKKHERRGSSSSSSSSSSDSDSDHEKKKKNHKHKDSQWK